MNDLSHVLESGFKDSMASTLFVGSRENEAIDDDIIKAVRDESTWKLPLDQGNCDKRQTRISVAVVLKAVWDQILPQVEDQPDIAKVWEALWDSLFVKVAAVTVGTLTGEWDNGLPSGWRWTAVLDTIINIASFTGIRKITEARLGKRVYIDNLYAQGDDVILSTKTLDATAIIMDTYS